MHRCCFIGLLLGRKNIQILAVSRERLALFACLFVDSPQPEISRGIIRIVPDRFFKTAERAAVVLSTKIKVANLH